MGYVTGLDGSSTDGQTERGHQHRARPFHRGTLTARHQPIACNLRRSTPSEQWSHIHHDVAIGVDLLVIQWVATSLPLGSEFSRASLAAVSMPPAPHRTTLSTEGNLIGDGLDGLDGLEDQLRHQPVFVSRGECSPGSSLNRRTNSLKTAPLPWLSRPAVSCWRLARARRSLRVKRGGVVERLPRRLAQGRILLDHADAVERSLHVEDRLLAALQHRVETAQHGHRQDHVAVIGAHVEVAQHIVGDSPYPRSSSGRRCSFSRYFLRWRHAAQSHRSTSAMALLTHRYSTRPAISPAGCNWSASDAPRVPASGTVRTSTPRRRSPLTTALETCSSV